jgi:hypothetical protein
MNAQQFWASAKANPDRVTDGVPCLEWQRRVYGRGGYGMVGYQGKVMTASRMAYIFANGSIPDDKFALHKCDNPKCIEPKHIYAGTRNQNADDLYARNEKVKQRRALIAVCRKLEKVRRIVVCHVLDKQYTRPYSRQRAWQIKKLSERKCMTCGKPSSKTNKDYCYKHRDYQNKIRKVSRKKIKQGDYEI